MNVVLFSAREIPDPSDTGRAAPGAPTGDNGADIEGSNAAQAVAAALHAVAEIKLVVSSDASVVLDLGRQARVEAVICTRFKDLEGLTNLHPSVALVLAHPAPDPDWVMQGYDLDVDAVWVLPLTGEQLKFKLIALVTRVQERVRQLNAEVHQARVELERDQRAGQHIQLGMLPPNPMGISQYKLQHKISPSLILSGDFVDYFQVTDRHFACYVADVAGHGASSAFVTVLLKNLSRRLRREYRVSMLRNPGEVLEWINAELLDQNIDKHVAMFFAFVDMQSSVMHYVNAAHFPPAMLRTDDNVQCLEQRGKPLGLFEDVKYAARSIDFPANSELVVFTDGVLDLLPGTTLVDKEAELQDMVKKHRSLDELWESLDPGQLGPDDVSCLLVSHGES